MKANKIMLFGIEYPIEIIRLWRKLHDHWMHWQEVHGAFLKMFPDENQSPHGEEGITGNEVKEMMLRKRGWSCSCHPEASAEIAGMARGRGFYAYYLG